MNFFEHQAKARRQSRWLIVAFLFAALAVILAVDLLVLMVLGFATPVTYEGGQILSPNAHYRGFNFFSLEFISQNAKVLMWTSLATASLVGLASVYKVSSLRGGGGQVARSLGGVLVDADTQDPLRRRLRNVVEEIAIASGVPVPEIYVLEQESAINAFAAGYSESDAAVAVTQGCLEKLSRSELQGVIAHEFSHVFNGDMRINIRLMGVLFGVLVIAMIGRRVMSSMRYSRSSRNDNGGAAIFIGLGLIAIGYVGLFFARWIKAALSRQREYLADASAVQYTRDPDSIAGALKKIAAYSAGSYLHADTEEVGHMLFGQGAKAFLFSTHPPITDRIQRIDPQFKEVELKYLAKKLHEETAKQLRQAREEAQADQSGDGKSAGGLGAVLNPGNIIDQIGHPHLDGILGAAIRVAELHPL
ncbi:M48 family metallopeptidase [bacterium]|nr:M48 family metallopeptidase [bacterium]